MKSISLRRSVPGPADRSICAEVSGETGNSATLLDGAILATVGGTGELLVFGTASADSIAIRQQPNTIAPATVGITLDSQDMSFSGVSKVYVYGYGAGDLIWADYGVNLPLNVYVGAAAEILGGSSGQDVLQGGSGSLTSEPNGAAPPPSSLWFRGFWLAPPRFPASIRTTKPAAMAAARAVTCRAAT